jgi:aspartyl-tRNA synthetase
VLRTHEAGTLRADHSGQTVTLAGWVAKRRDHGGVAFLDLRDASGVVQVVARDEVLDDGGGHDLRNEYCVQITGEVRLRPEGNANADLPTGAVEVVASTLEVLNAAAPLPFQIDERVTVGEEARLKYRYLDLRRPGPGAAIRLRSKVNAAAREVLAGHDFVEIETPTMTRSTPEGARDFIVPARLAPGSWYALPQSPQLFKQLLMVAGMERYYQIARCYRDEDFRADRQPEFTQLDIEMSFVEQDDILALGEEIAVALWKLIGVDIPTPLPRLTYAEAMARFGTDKPDTRFGQELVDCTAYFADTAFRVFQADYVGLSSCPAARASPVRPSTPGRSSPSSAALAAWPTSWSRRTASWWPGGQEPLRRRAGRSGCPRRRGPRRLRVLRGRRHQGVPGPARRGPARDRQARRAHRRGFVEPPVGPGRAVVRAGR